MKLKKYNLEFCLEHTVKPNGKMEVNGNGIRMMPIIVLESIREKLKMDYQMVKERSIQLMAKGDGYAQLKLRSGEIRKVRGECMATVGTGGNPEHMNIKIGKAGRNRWLGHRPTVRGVVMNPVDHPHGGGEGKTSGGRHPVTPWGMPTKGAKTRKRKDTDKYILKRK